jgi:L-ascorbate metabolism protein UlaG (beta-lactamase superfamily)
VSRTGARSAPLKRVWFWVRRASLALAVVAGGAALVAVVAGWRGFGHRATGARRERMERSPEFRDGKFRNPQPMVNDGWLMLRGALHSDPNVRPAAPVPTVPDAAAKLRVPAASGLRATWLGHSTALLEIGRTRVLTDPMWSEHATPIAGFGPRRTHPPPIALAELPPIDVVVVSHDHYDHLDMPSVQALSARGVRFVVPLGIGAHLAYWGVPEARITELDWWDTTKVGELAITCTPARHATGRMIVDDDAKLWAGFAFIGAGHRVYYSGDTGLFPALREIGQRLGPFELTLIEVGQYGPAWPDWHLGPEQAVLAHQWVRGGVMLPVHWGTFSLAYHGWTEPPERVLAAARAAGVTVALPKPGESFEPASPPPVARWWPNLPWKTARQAPIVATQVDRAAPLLPAGAVSVP